MYAVGTSPPATIDALRFWLLDELAKLARESLEPRVAGVTLKELNAAPQRLYTGLTVLADGTNWNPGAGQGVYTYYAAAWHKLG